MVIRIPASTTQGLTDVELSLAIHFATAAFLEKVSEYRREAYATARGASTDEREEVGSDASSAPTKQAGDEPA